MDVRIIRDHHEIEVKGIVPSMVIIGASGHRTYGGHMPVLPGQENVCLVDSMSTWRKITQKKLFYLGRHGELPEVKFYAADRVDIGYRGRIPMQLDGELVWLAETDFPISLQVLPSCIKVLRYLP